MAYKIAVGPDGQKVVMRSATGTDGKQQWFPSPEQDMSLAEEKKPKFDMKAYQKKAQQQLAEETGTGAAILIGAGRELDKLGSGTANLWDSAMSSFGSEESRQEARDSMAARAKDQDMKDKIFAPLSEESPWATGGGAVLPYLATLPAGLAATGVRAAAPTIGRAVLPTVAKTAMKNTARKAPAWLAKAARGAVGKNAVAAPNYMAKTGTKTALAKLLAGESIIGAGTGAMHYDDTALEGGLWGLGGAFGGKLMGDFLGGTAERISGDLPRVVKNAKKYGIKLMPGEKTGDKGLQQLDGAVTKHHRTANKIDKMNEISNQSQNRAITKELGGPEADYLTNDYVTMQKDRITDEMDNLVKGTEGEFTDEAAYAATDILEQYKRTNVDDSIKPILKRFENKIYDMADSGERLGGKQYQDFMKDLNKTSSNQYGSATGDRELARSLTDIAGIFNNAIGTGLGEANSDAWKKINREFALISALDEARDIKGFVNPRQLAKKFKSSKTVNELGEIRELQDRSDKASLGASQLLAKSLGDVASGSPSNALASTMLLSGRATGGVFGLDDAATSLYMAGWPHVTGVFPGAKHVKKGIAKTRARLTMSDVDKSLGDEEDESNWYDNLYKF